MNPQSRALQLRAAATRVGRALRTPTPEERRSTPYPDMEADFGPLYESCRPFTMTSVERMYALWLAVRYVERVDIPGDVVECGVWRGGSSMLAGLTLRDLGDSRPQWLYDTFEGMSAPTERDRRPGRSPVTLEEVEETGGYLLGRASLDEVKENMGSLEAEYVVGKVEDTIPGRIPERIALLRLDTDWYESTRHELEQLWPLLSPGGVLILDDYGFWAGAREAADEFFAGRSDAPLLHRIDSEARVAVKAKLDAH